MSKKTLKEFLFHSHYLYPSTIIETGDDGIKHFDEVERRYHSFRNGDRVVNIDNQDQIMIVTRPVYSKKKIKGKYVNHLDGILCHWFSE